LTLVVFLRGVNVGGKTFQPSVLARELSSLDVTSLGAAGTFVVRRAASASAVRAAFVKQLPFEAHVLTCREGEIADLVAADPLRGREAPGVTRYVTIVDKPPRPAPAVPHRVPAGSDWQVEIVAVRGCFVMSRQRRVGKRFIYPNEVVEKLFGVRATTRNWNTILKVHDALGR
jgi:uncharacterized protein (DUF1697 family)